MVHGLGLVLGVGLGLQNYQMIRLIKTGDTQGYGKPRADWQERNLALAEEETEEAGLLGTKKQQTIHQDGRQKGLKPGMDVK